LPKAVKNIVGVQFRNMATIGAGVYSKYGFGNITTALLALNADVVLFHGGRIKLQSFLANGYDRDILVEIIIPNIDIKASYQSIRNSYSDYSILNVAAARGINGWRIAVGARPGVSQVSLNSSAFLNKGTLKDEDILYASKLAAEELTFGSNMLGSEKYRKNICEVFVRRAIQEVLS
jgi:CO/xanthine dehydrogenase FAD-binding subunit